MRMVCVLVGSEPVIAACSRDRRGVDGMWGSVVLLFSQWTCVVGNSVRCYPDRGVHVSGRSDKTYFLQLRPKNNHEINIKINCDNKLIKETRNTKFLGLDIDSFLSWKDHIEQLMFKLGRACSAIRYVKYMMSQDTLRTIYFIHFHSNLPYGIIFWDNSAYSSNIFKIQKRVIRVIMNARNRDYCQQLFKKLKIVPLQSQYIFPPSIICSQK